MKFPSKPSRGQRALQSIYNSLIQVIDFLPSLQVRGDTTTTSVTHSSAGTIIHAKQTPQAPKKQVVEGGEGEQYFAGEGLRLQIIDNNNTFSIKPPDFENWQTKNYALVCLSGTIQWVQLGTCDEDV